MIIGIVGMLAACVGIWLLRRKRILKYCPPVTLSCSDALIFLKPGKNQLKERELLWRKKLLLGSYALLGGSVLLVVGGYWQAVNEESPFISQIERPEPGEGSKKLILSAWIGNEEEVPVTIDVQERVPQAEEAERALQQSYILLQKRILGENESLEEVSNPLNLVTYLEETACQVYWYIDNTEYIDRNGTVHTEGVEGKTQVDLTAEISLGSYRKEYAFTVFVVPGEMTEKEKLVYDMKQAIRQAEREGGAERTVSLPAVINGYRIIYSEPLKEQGNFLWLLVIIVVFGCTFLPEQELLQKKKEKEAELNLAYPEIVSKLCLLIGSGLTVRKAWERIIQDYRETRSFHYAYEEMLLTYYELERGMPEGKAYASFGRRCRMHGYRKLGSLLEQNLKKGTSGLLALLKEETWQAFEDRRAYAVKLAQEAGTRMLLPMILLLLVVLVICVAPAVMSF